MNYRMGITSSVVIMLLVENRAERQRGAGLPSARTMTLVPTGVRL
jgi:hypothetical protein